MEEFVVSASSRGGPVEPRLHLRSTKVSDSSLGTAHYAPPSASPTIDRPLEAFLAFRATGECCHAHSRCTIPWKDGMIFGAEKQAIGGGRIVKRILQCVPMFILAFVALTAQAADPAKGETLAANCGACHNAGQTPLAGKDTGSLTSAMNAIRAGERAHPPVLSGASDEDICSTDACFLHFGTFGGIGL